MFPRDLSCRLNALFGRSPNARAWWWVVTTRRTEAKRSHGGTPPFARWQVCSAAMQPAPLLASAMARRAVLSALAPVATDHTLLDVLTNSQDCCPN